MLREYDAVYTTYMEYLDIAAEAHGNAFVESQPDIPIKFKLMDGQIFLTDEHIKQVTISHNTDNDTYAVNIIYNEIGADIIAEVSSQHIGEPIYIVASLYYDHIDMWQDDAIVAPYINSAITGSVSAITVSSKKEANSLYTYLASKSINRSVKNAILNYNTKCSEYVKKYSLSEYLPNSLSSDTGYIDISDYLQKAEAAGFTE